MAKKTQNSKVAAMPMDDWQTEDDLRTLCRAEEIKKDSKRMSKCKALAKKKMMEVAAIASETED